jgi:hypothetical protein
LDDLVDDAPLEEDYILNVDADGRVQATVTPNSGTTTSADEAVATTHESSSSSSSSSSATGRKLRARFGRRRTHNEQLVVAPCGMILARETFYGAEGVGSVIVRGQLPELMIY